MRFLLIIPSNLNSNTTINILIAYRILYQCEFAILFLESAETDSLDRNLRNTTVKEIFGENIEIRERKIASRPGVAITDIVNSALKEFGKEQIVVDLTNGTKETTSLLYMASSLSKITNINYINVKKDQEGKFIDLSSVTGKDLGQFIDKKIFEPLQDIKLFGKWNYFDLIFYKESFKDILSQYPPKMSEFVDKWNNQFTMGIEQYFDPKDKFMSSAKTLGLLMEDIYSKIISEFQLQNLKEFECHFDEIRKKHKHKQVFGDHRDMNFVTDMLFSVVRHYRNMASHNIETKFDEIDMQLMIHCILKTVKNIRGYFK